MFLHQPEERDKTMVEHTQDNRFSSIQSNNDIRAVDSPKQTDSSHIYEISHKIIWIFKAQDLSTESTKIHIPRRQVLTLCLHQEIY